MQGRGEVITGNRSIADYQRRHCWAHRHRNLEQVVIRQSSVGELHAQTVSTCGQRRHRHGHRTHGRWISGDVETDRWDFYRRGIVYGQGHAGRQARHQHRELATLAGQEIRSGTAADHRGVGARGQRSRWRPAHNLPGLRTERGNQRIAVILLEIRNQQHIRTRSAEGPQNAAQQWIARRAIQAPW